MGLTSPIISKLVSAEKCSYLYRSGRSSNVTRHARDALAATRTTQHRFWLLVVRGFLIVVALITSAPPYLSSSPPAHRCLYFRAPSPVSLPTHALRALTDVRYPSFTLTKCLMDKTAPNMVMRTTNSAFRRPLAWHSNSKHNVCPQAQCLRRSPSTPP